jgi:hypothetical protein
VPETPRPAELLAGTYDPFAVPDSRRHLRHAFYLRHPELDQRTPLDRTLDRDAYEAEHRRRERELSAPAESYLDPELPPEHDPMGLLERAGSGDPRDDLAEAVRRFLDGRATLADLRDALDRTEERR